MRIEAVGWQNHLIDCLEPIEGLGDQRSEASGASWLDQGCQGMARIADTTSPSHAAKTVWKDRAPD